MTVGEPFGSRGCIIILTSIRVDTVISSFPRRWGRNKPDPSAVHRGIRDRLGSLNADEIHSVYDIALIVVDECSKVFFDHTKPLDQRPEVMDLFGSAISKIVSLELFVRSKGRQN